MQYRTLENILMDGRYIAPGTLIDLPEHEARPLLESQAIETSHKPFLRVQVPSNHT